jgi:hypothetical protein
VTRLTDVVIHDKPGEMAGVGPSAWPGGCAVPCA